MKVFAENQMLWMIRAIAEGSEPVEFAVDGREVIKSFTVGEGYTRTSVLRPGLAWLDVVMCPAERPFGRDSAVQSISIDYPDRASVISGTDRWAVYFFVVCIIFGFAFMPVFKVKI